ncbi:MAG: DUF4325 domain-containing protein [Deltaproteobacteria bacterium]|nr:DUF4325 domain-containing protein [Deltaproteobacteria bacterium]
MNILDMSKYGTILTGRGFGKQTIEELNLTLEYPVELDFRGVTSLGSSFGDEVVPVIAGRQDNQLTVIGPNKAIWDCLLQIAEECKIQIIKRDR